MHEERLELDASALNTPLQKAIVSRADVVKEQVRMKYPLAYLVCKRELSSGSERIAAGAASCSMGACVHEPRPFGSDFRLRATYLPLFFLETRLNAADVSHSGGCSP